MAKLSRTLLYPEPLFGGLPAVDLTNELTLIHSFGTAEPVAHRIPFLFESPTRVLVRVASALGAENNWLRAGSLAQVLSLVPGDPKKEVKRLYLDEAFFEFDGAGYAYYFEFWPVKWLADYYLEIWAQDNPGRTIVVIDNDTSEPLTINGQTFTVGGIEILI